MNKHSNFTSARKAFALVSLAGLVALGAACAPAEPKAGPVTNPPTTEAAPVEPVADAPVTEAPAPEAPPVTEAPTPPPSEAPAPELESKGFVLQSLSVQADFTDAFEGTARIVDNEGGRSATFTITLFAGDVVVGTMSAMVSDSPVGEAQTVGFMSSDKLVDFDRYEFQTDAAF